MSDPSFSALPDAADTGDLSALGEQLDPLGLTKPALGTHARTAQRGWTSFAGTMGRKVPNHLKWSLRYRNATLKLTRRGSRLR